MIIMWYLVSHQVGQQKITPQNCGIWLIAKWDNRKSHHNGRDILMRLYNHS